MERAVLFAPGAELGEAASSPPLRTSFKALRKQALEKLEKDYLEQALAR